MSWPVVSAENALRAAWAVYATVAAVAFAIGAWTIAHWPSVTPIGGMTWAPALMLGAFGAWRVRLLQLRLRRRPTIASVWPLAAVAMLGLFTNPFVALLLVIGLFEVLQARYVLHLAPVED
ncbi:MAG TPA: hypothetical protein VFS42_05555 [Burkholderiaceae bacterium]|nr:hypothetical protein [Burkholderiaceae bacterium]